MNFFVLNLFCFGFFRGGGGGNAEIYPIEKNGNYMLLEHVFESFLFTGLDHDGIYRISGNLAQIQKLRCQVDQGKKTKLIYSMLIF